MRNNKKIVNNNINQVGKRKFLPLVQCCSLLLIIISGYLQFRYMRLGTGMRLLTRADLNPYAGFTVFFDFLSHNDFVWRGLTMSIALTIALVVMAVIGGRFFCGWLCPIGALQDFGRAVGRFFHVQLFKISAGWQKLFYLKYLILVVIVGLALLGKQSFLAKLSPWSEFLRIVTGSFLTEINPVLGIGFYLLLFSVVIAMWIPRVFCRYLCPLGAIQGLLSQFAVLKIKKPVACTGCSHCMRTCAIGNGLSATSAAMISNCVACVGCVEDDCSQDALGVGIYFAKSKKINKGIYISIMLSLFFLIWWGLPQVDHYVQAANIPATHIAVADGIYQAESMGYGGNITVAVTIAQQQISKIKILSHSETPGWCEEAFAKVPKEIIKNQNWQVDAVTGATKTSDAIMNAVRKSIAGK